MTTDILDLPGWTVLNKRLDAHEYELEAEYTVQPTACQNCHRRFHTDELSGHDSDSTH